MADVGLPLETGNRKPTKSVRLEDQAATAALYVTGNKGQQNKRGQEFLDKDHKLSSAGKHHLRKLRRIQLMADI